MGTIMSLSAESARDSSFNAAEKSTFATAEGTFLGTKFRAPGLPRDCIQFAHYARIFDEASQSRLTYMVAPPAYGKSTIMASYYALRKTVDITVCWLNLDDNDNDPSRFLFGLAFALQPAFAGSVGSELIRLAGSSSMALDAVVCALCNHLLASPRKLTLFLDDFHFIENPAVHQILEILLMNSGPNIQFFVASRARLPMALAKLRMDGQVCQIDTTLMCVQQDEAKLFVETTSGQNLTLEQAHALYEWTEGWIGGLQLVSQALRKVPDVAFFISHFSGDDSGITHYLGEIVLSQLSPQHAEFVVLTSVLDRFSAELCNDILGVSDAASTIAWLRSNSIFVISLDTQNTWFRYHHLFHDFLRHCLSAYADKVSSVYLEASQWFLKKHLVREAIEFALKAEDFKVAGELIDTHGCRLMAEQQAQPLEILKWISQIPDFLSPRMPRLPIIQAYCQMMEQNYAQAETTIHNVRVTLGKSSGFAGELATDAASIEKIERELAAYEANLHMAMDATAKSYEESMAWLNRWGNLDIPHTGHLLIVAGYSASREHQDYAFARKSIASARVNFRKLGADGSLPWADVFDSLVLIQMGEIVSAHRLLAATSAEFSARAGQGYFGSVVVDVIRAAVAYEQNMLDEAEALLHASFPFIYSNAIIDCPLLAYLTRSRLHFIRGRHDEAYALLQKGIEYANDRPGFDRFGQLLRLECAELMLRTGDIRSALDHASLLGLTAESIGASKEIHTPYHDVALAIRILDIRLQIELGRTDRTRLQISWLLNDARSKGRGHSTLKLLLLRSLLERALGNQKDSLRFIEEALLIAAKGGYIRTLEDEGPALMAQLREIADNRSVFGQSFPQEDQNGYLLNLLRQPAPDSMVSTSADILRHENAAVISEALSERELQILKMADKGLSNLGIAGHLFISEATVKWHLHRIYRKLDVKNRSSAIAQVRKQGRLNSY